MKTFLKVKIKSLDAEARIIKKEEYKAQGQKNPLREDLHNHRINVVRKECRATLLAYGFLKGYPFYRIERFAKDQPDWERVMVMVYKYGRPYFPDLEVLRDSFARWKKLGENQISGNKNLENVEKT